MSVEIRPSSCRRCGTLLGGATGVEDPELRPFPGAVSICWTCGTVSLFADDLSLREPSLAELDELLDAPEVTNALGRLWDLRLARVEAGDSVVFACGCRTTAGAGLFTLEACAEACAAAQTVIRLVRRAGKPLSIIR